MRKLLFLPLLLLSGCGIGMIAAGTGVSKTGTANIMNAYNDYVIRMETINVDREKAGLAPRPILNKHDWLNGGKTKERDEWEP